MLMCTLVKFYSFMNRDLFPRKLLSFHSILYIISLAVQDSVEHLLKHWIKQIILLCTCFARSSKWKHKLNECYVIEIENLDNMSNEFGDAHETHGWQMFYPRIHCYTRWIGLYA